jgi:hypothetical protein
VPGRGGIVVEEPKGAGGGPFGIGGRSMLGNYVLFQFHWLLFIEKMKKRGKQNHFFGINFSVPQGTNRKHPTTQQWDTVNSFLQSQRPNERKTETKDLLKETESKM